MVAVVAYALGRAVVAVYESSVGFPSLGRLMLEFFAIGVMCLDMFGNLGVDCCCNCGRDFVHLRGELPDVLGAGQRLLQGTTIEKVFTSEICRHINDYSPSS